ncbi:hypothetical protein FVP73_15570 [Listeria monocytogenes]|nr:hypothetical protein [Listeria monocytogenes]EAE5300343.1 hypothetical protein [Listeria monocytogenes]EAE6894651.1 hypothetical protein [Listeria monocytogenes]EAE7881573.1 hypothetical protein [Listeria monocytogenes]EAE8290920.1 hypothetical protein [Listeria monocytogenes]
MKNNLFDVVGMVLMLGITVLMEIYFSALFRLNVQVLYQGLLNREPCREINSFYESDFSFV